MSKDYLENSYKVMSAVGIYDRGFDKKEGEDQYFGMSGLDTNNDGVIDEEETNAVKSRLYKIAIEAGAGEILEKFNGVVPKKLCVDFGAGGKIASDDSVMTFDKGQIIDPAITDISGDLIRFLESRGLIVGTRFIKADGTLDLDKLQAETPKEVRDSSHPSTASFIQVSEDGMNKFKSGYSTAKTFFSYLAGAYPVVAPASILFSITDYLIDSKIIASDEKETFMEVVSRLAK